MRDPFVNRLRASLNRPVQLGTDVSTGESVSIPLAELQRVSAHVLGSAGAGKTRWLCWLVRELIRLRQVVWILSPHPDLYRFVISELRRAAIPPERILLIDPGDTNYAVAFNPLRPGLEDPSTIASMVLESVRTAWGAESMDATPRMEGLLRGLCHLLAANELTLLEAPAVLEVDNIELRRALRERLSDEWVREDWRAFDKLPRTDRIAITGSTQNRLRRFLQAPTLQCMFGQRDRAVDLLRLLDDGYYAALNLGNTPAPETQRLVGSLFLNALYHSAKMRDPQKRRNVFVIVDECARFASAELAESLDELRKFGVTFFLAHQRLSQLSSNESQLLSAVTTNCRLKAVFSGLSRRDAEFMAQEFFTGEITGQRIKHSTVSTKFRPLDTKELVESESWSETEGESESEGWSESDGWSDSSASSETTGSSDSEGTGRSESEGATYEVDEDTPFDTYRDEDITSRGLNSGSSDTASHTDSSSRTESSGHTESSSSSKSGSWSSNRATTTGGSRSWVPVTKHEEFKEESGRTYVSVDEEREQYIARIHGLARREVLVRLHNGPVHHIRTPEMPDPKNDRAIERFAERCLARSPFVLPAADARREIDQRRRELAGLVEANTARTTIDVKTFKE